MLTDDCSPTEATVMQMWTEILPVSSTASAMSVDDDFFDLDGDSIGLMRFLFEVQDRYGVELPVVDLFSTGFTVAEVSRAIDNLVLLELPRRRDSREVAS